MNADKNIKIAELTSLTNTQTLVTYEGKLRHMNTEDTTNSISVTLICEDEACLDCERARTGRLGPAPGVEKLVMERRTRASRHTVLLMSVLSATIRQKGMSRVTAKSM